MHAECVCVCFDREGKERISELLKSIFSTICEA